MIGRINAAGTSVYLKASLDTLWKRLNTDPRQLEDRPLLRSGGKGALRDLLRAREAAYLSATVTLDTDQLSVDEACDLLEAHMRSISPAP